MEHQSGIVIIGRNEGVRLTHCINALGESLATAVYVDSGSTDDSCELMRNAGIPVVELDDSRGFSAARARNEGFAELTRRIAAIDYIQFVDGDCQLCADWIERAVGYMRAHSRVAVLSGRRRELKPLDSLYNDLLDMEWNTPVGIVKQCGGDALVRVDVFKRVRGFRETMIAGEEPEMCFRIRSLGYEIHRIDADMTVHDAAMHKFSQWWTRSVRSGHAYAALLRHTGEWPHYKSIASIVLWGLLFPVGTLLISCMHVNGLLLLMAYVLPWSGAFRYQLRRGASSERALKYASMCVLGKFAECHGVLMFAFRSFGLGRDSTLIEYKD